MSETIEYPQGAKPVRTRRALKVVLASLGAAVIVVALSWGGVAWAKGIAAQRAHIQAVALQRAANESMPQLQANTATAADESDASSADQVVTAEQAREAAAAALAAQQAATAAAYAAAHARASDVGADGLIQCPAGSQADAGDSSGATLCLPDICFHITLPDPAHPECVTAFKP